MKRLTASGIVLGACVAIVFLVWNKAFQKDVTASESPQRVATDKAPKHERSLMLPSEALAKNPIATAKVAKLKLAPDLQVVGSITYDRDHYAVVGPLVSGRVASLDVKLGDKVKAGQVLAQIESAEAGQAAADYLSAAAQARAAEANLRRERELAENRISSVRDRELAEAQSVSATAHVQAAQERMLAFGFGKAEIESLRGGVGTGGRVPLRAPIAGTVVQRLITLGEAVERATDAFKIANLERLWVLLDLYEKDMRRVRVGQRVEIRLEARPDEVFQGQVAYFSPQVDESTRTSNVRIELSNPGGKLTPGQFVTARILGEPDAEHVEALAIPRRSVAMVDGKYIAFLRTEHGFERRVVELGVSGGDLVEIKNGLMAGEEVATDGAFLLKSELLR